VKRLQTPYEADWAVTLKALPPAAGALVTASVLPASGANGPKWGPGPMPEPGASMIRVADQAESEIVPAWPLVEVALALLKRMVPKSVSGRICVPRSVTADGASATHSAELMSGADMRSVRAKL
jgi:hypothetical protein